MFKLFCACKKNVVCANLHRGSQMPLYKSIKLLMVVIIKKYKKIFALFINRSRFVPERFRIFCGMLLTNSTKYLEPVVRTPIKFNPPLDGLKKIMKI